MSTTDPDEKACPFCGARIKAAAVKCSHCRADLPASFSAGAAPAGRSELRAVLTPTAGEAPVPEQQLAVVRSAPGRGASWWKPLPVALLVLCALLVAGITRVILEERDLEPARPVAATAPAGSGLVPGAVGGGFPGDSPEVAAALSAAARNVVAVLSYDYRTLARDQARAHAVMTDSFVVEYDEVMAKTKPKAVRGKLALEATVEASSLVSLEQDRAVALLFVNAVTTAKDSPKQQLNENRVLMTMTRQDGDWIVSQIEAF